MRPCVRTHLLTLVLLATQVAPACTCVLLFAGTPASPSFPGIAASAGAPWAAFPREEDEMDGAGEAGGDLCSYRGGVGRIALLPAPAVSPDWLLLTCLEPAVGSVPTSAGNLACGAVGAPGAWPACPPPALLLPLLI